MSVITIIASNEILEKNSTNFNIHNQEQNDENLINNTKFTVNDKDNIYINSNIIKEEIKELKNEIQEKKKQIDDEQKQSDVLQDAIRNQDDKIRNQDLLIYSLNKKLESMNQEFTNLEEKKEKMLQVLQNKQTILKNQENEFLKLKQLDNIDEHNMENNSSSNEEKNIDIEGIEDIKENSSNENEQEENLSSDNENNIENHLLKNQEEKIPENIDSTKLNNEKYLNRNNITNIGLFGLLAGFIIRVLGIIDDYQFMYVYLVALVLLSTICCNGKRKKLETNENLIKSINNNYEKIGNFNLNNQTNKHNVSPELKQNHSIIKEKIQ